MTNEIKKNVGVIGHIDNGKRTLTLAVLRAQEMRRKGAAMANTRPLKKHRKIAAGMVEQIEYLTARWHLSFSPVELTVLQKALAAYATVTAGKKADQ